MNKYQNIGSIENIVNSLRKYIPSMSRMHKEVKAYLVDTSAKVGTYAVPMGIMEASKGLSLEQIIQSRTSVAIADAVLGRLYGKALNYTRNKFNPEGKGGVKGYLVDTATMLAVYDPAYMLILKKADANWDQIKSATFFLTVILMLSARPFSKYILDNWRRYWKTK